MKNEGFKIFKPPVTGGYNPEKWRECGFPWYMEPSWEYSHLFFVLLADGNCFSPPKGGKKGLLWLLFFACQVHINPRDPGSPENGFIEPKKTYAVVLGDGHRSCSSSENMTIDSIGKETTNRFSFSLLSCYTHHQLSNNSWRKKIMIKLHLTNLDVTEIEDLHGDFLKSCPTFLGPLGEKNSVTEKSATLSPPYP